MSGIIGDEFIVVGSLAPDDAVEHVVDATAGVGEVGTAVANDSCINTPDNDTTGAPSSVRPTARSSGIPVLVRAPCYATSSRGERNRVDDQHPSGGPAVNELIEQEEPASAAAGLKMTPATTDMDWATLASNSCNADTAVVSTELSVDEEPISDHQPADNPYESSDISTQSTNQVRKPSATVATAAASPAAERQICISPSKPSSRGGAPGSRTPVAAASNHSPLQQPPLKYKFSHTSASSFPDKGHKAPSPSSASVTNGSGSGNNGNADHQRIKMTSAFEKRREQIQRRVAQHNKPELGVYDYTTPTQRQDLIIKELNAEIKRVTRVLNSKTTDAEEQRLTEHRLEVENVSVQKDKEIQDLKDQLEEEKQKIPMLKEINSDTENELKLIQQKLDALEEHFKDSEVTDAQIMFKMYEKGRKQVLVDRQQEEEEKRYSSNGGASNDTASGRRRLSQREKQIQRQRILHEIDQKSKELTKWQTLHRRNPGGGAAENGQVDGKSPSSTSSPSSDAAVFKYQCLKDATYFYLTNEDATHEAQFQDVMVKVLGFSESQLKYIQWQNQ